MADVLTDLENVAGKIKTAATVVDGDKGSSPVLAAVIREFEAKSDKARAAATDAARGRDAVIELEQAGDSAKAAAEADSGIEAATRQAVLDAHLAICKLKAGL